MTTFSRRFRPDHLAGQVAILILVAIVLFHVMVTIALGFLSVERRSPFIGPVEFTASYILAIDLAPVSDRQKIIGDLAALTPWTKFALRDDRPAVADRHDPEIDVLRARLWKGAEVFPVSSPSGNDSRAAAIALRKGGYAIASLPPPQWSARLRTPASPGLAGPPGAGESPPPEPAPAPTPAPPPPAPPPGPPSTGVWIGSALFFFLCATILTAWISNVVVAPLVKLARQAERFPNECGERELIAEEGPQEVRDLTRALNRMQDRIYSMIAARSRILAAISHDLRTIITRLRLRAEFIGDDTLRAKMLHDVDLMDAMLHKNLLHLREERYRQAHGLIDLDSVLQTVADQFSDLGHEVSYEGGGRHMVVGSLTDMQRVFNNLVENATAHARKIVISVEQPSSDVLLVDVADDGPGISAEDKERVLEPFVRGEQARNMNEHGGFGLGLSIVCSLLEDVGGSLQLLDRDPHGLIARVTLPRGLSKWEE